MTILELIHFAEENALSDAIVQECCDQEQLNLHELYVAFAKNIVEGYSNNRYSWDFCDGAINNLFSHAYFNETGIGLPSYAYDVFIAFDEGEYLHKGDPPDFNGEIRTKALLKDLENKMKAEQDAAANP